MKTLIGKRIERIASLVFRIVFGESYTLDRWFCLLGSLKDKVIM